MPRLSGDTLHELSRGHPRHHIRHYCELFILTNLWKLPTSSLLHQEKVYDQMEMIGVLSKMMCAIEYWTRNM